MRELVDASALSWHIPRAVVDEALFVRAVDEAGEPTLVEVDLQPLIAEGVLDVCFPNASEFEQYVALAQELDDGEAMGIAIACERQWLFATDDRKAQRTCEKMGVSVITTPELIKSWSDGKGVGKEDARRVLSNIESFARFAPRPISPLYNWWADLTRGS